MLDTLKIRLNNWQVKDGANITIKRGSMDYQSGEIKDQLLFRDSNGKDIRGSSAYINTEKINLDIKPLMNNVYAFVQFSLPKQLHETNYQPARECELIESLQHVENELFENGIETKIDQANISRLDINKDIQISESVMSYARVFEVLSANRAKNRKTYGVNGWLFSNNRLEYCIYDKLEEMKKNNQSITGLPETLRFEHRCLTGAKVKEFYNFTTIEELKRVGFVALEEKQKQTWKENFFKYEVEELECIVESTIRLQLQYFQAKHGRQYFQRYLQWQGAYLLATSYAGTDIVLKALKNMESNRMKLNRAEKELKESLIIAGEILPEPINRKTLASLYIELKEKVCYV
jgi:hypothetical protein